MAKTTTQVSAYLNSELVDEFDNVRRQLGMTRSALLRLLIMRVCMDHSPATGSPVAMAWSPEFEPQETMQLPY